MTIKATYISCNFLSGIPWLRSNLIKYNLYEQMDKTYKTCSSKFKLSGNNNTKKPSLALCSAESSIDSVAYTVRDGWSRDFRWFLVVITRQNGYSRGN